MKAFTTHRAIRIVREGRGATMLVPECDLVSIGGPSLHILDTTGRPVCGRQGEIAETLQACDPHALVVERRSVCATCRERVGFVPPPSFADEVENGRSLGITRTELDRQRRAVA